MDSQLTSLLSSPLVKMIVGDFVKKFYPNYTETYINSLSSEDMIFLCLSKLTESWASKPDTKIYEELRSRFLPVIQVAMTMQYNGTVNENATNEVISNLLKALACIYVEPPMSDSGIFIVHVECARAERMLGFSVSAVKDYIRSHLGNSQQISDEGNILCIVGDCTLLKTIFLEATDYTESKISPQITT